MNDIAGMPTLALILFGPWFLILSVLYWLYPRQPRNAARRAFDAFALLLAFIGCLASLHWSFGLADRSYGRLWPQILATSVGYGVFLGVLTIAFLVRRKAFPKPMPRG